METQLQSKTILLVDDDVDFLAQHQALLAATGAKVITAESQAQAEEILKQTKPSLAILDLMMEHVDAGFALCHHIKKLDPKIPVIIVTAVNSETGIDFDAATVEERSWLKADAFLNKPVRFEQLLAEIDKLL